MGATAGWALQSPRTCGPWTPSKTLAAPAVRVYASMELMQQWVALGHLTACIPVRPSPRPSTVQAVVADLSSAAALDVANTGTQGSSILRNTPVIALTPNPLAFGSVPVGTGHSATVTIYSSGVASLSLSSLTITGSNPSDFTQSNNCTGSVLATGAHCTVTVTFTPQAKGSRSAALNISSTVQAAPFRVSVSGSGR